MTHDPDRPDTTLIPTPADSDAAVRPLFTGRATPIDGVLDSSTTITGTQVGWGDPVDLPVADTIAGLVVFHVPRWLDPGRHHQSTPTDYLGWLVEVIDEAERVLEPGGRLILIAKPHEAVEPHIDTPNQLLDPLATAGFTTPKVHTWLPEPAGPGDDTSTGLERSARSWWRVLIAAKNHDHRAGTPRQRRRLGLPHTTGTVPDHLARLAARSHWPAVTPPGAPITQGALPTELVTLLLSVFSLVDDVVVNPLTGPSATVADVARQLHRRALCFEPDRDILARHHPTSVDPTADRGDER
jgi:hypothetical protein